MDNDGHANLDLVEPAGLNSDEGLIDLGEIGLLLIQARAAARARQPSRELILKFLHLVVDSLPAELRESDALTHDDHRPDGLTINRYYRFVR